MLNSLAEENNRFKKKRCRPCERRIKVEKRLEQTLNGTKTKRVLLLNELENPGREMKRMVRTLRDVHRMVGDNLIGESTELDLRIVVDEQPLDTSDRVTSYRSKGVRSRTLRYEQGTHLSPTDAMVSDRLETAVLERRSTGRRRDRTRKP